MKQQEIYKRPVVSVMSGTRAEMASVDGAPNWVWEIVWGL
ncbi:hypothetical protein FOCG_13769 [Fusarium oxysporum f. sp. radicis-lycopersici 26381]|uniref:Uncharacterized protein n=2 Tax=Fusarium oxysporum TaxID=5507 RepID=W9I653_FUSOX|nr:hypothetical protein FOYG_09599 [Fusarium oxysporum NRRL 32931]EWZ40121.1 hypothetical protein FOZG_08948 [Fusarium oxysporum Fo47]EWZ87803.1 hypothetical protein FOWG_09511 [Fusarium oxysporum f. sp. lycopersici MN25]EXL44974.1 hypothetical protein FOCG_13769 [Fusarium oxysporum f. sp. radicis-lycopersici 26381]